MIVLNNSMDYTLYAQVIREGKYMLQPLGSSKYLDVSGSCENQNGCKVQLYSIGRSAKNNTFLIKKSEFGKTFKKDYYNIVCNSTNKVIDADRNNLGREGCKIQVWDLQGLPLLGEIFSGHQDFRFERVATNQYRIIIVAPSANSKLMGIPRNLSNRNNTPVGLYSSGSAVTVWVLTQIP
ncbi:MAG: RICIN domain-containing protein [Saprospiraceae bacterium]|nr:RICIN domain-containing protein [Saprospiraceae bacterium]HMX88619.1 RICIN domain-containing protein [Saprospiraceae bacterium]HMZ40199.1 RICIN domain-containing protein [Saprospiraceae bacterium]HNC35943.1 RICIN domain-containing protein [Saprospiraceae bacterium]HNE63166.1 RICIN domain-containing protein [Saprospiraceae bacterium]